MEEFKKFLKEYYFKEYPDRKFILGPNNELDGEKLGIDTSKVDVNKLSYEQLVGLLNSYFFYEDVYE
tara:strand:+ start:408 stop:608 length:201 start_codon:yes stop_codon:yes gene_type:complete